MGVYVCEVPCPAPPAHAGYRGFACISVQYRNGLFFEEILLKKIKIIFPKKESPIEGDPLSSLDQEFQTKNPSLIPRASGLCLSSDSTSLKALEPSHGFLLYDLLHHQGLPV